MVTEWGPPGGTGTLGNGDARGGTGVLGDRRDCEGTGEPGAVGTQRKMRVGNGELGRMKGLGSRGDPALTGAWARGTEIWGIPLLPGWGVWVGEEPPIPPLPHSSSAAVSCLSSSETFLQLLLRGAKAGAGRGVLAGVAGLGWGLTPGSGGAGALAFVCQSP